MTHNGNCNTNCFLRKTLDNDTSHVHISDDDSCLNITNTSHCLFSEDNSSSPSIHDMASVPIKCNIRITHDGSCGASNCLFK